ncbi:hypothetical protein JDY09_02540 [Thermoleophilum album]|jgi:hypothetical protein|uniref:hypothetical protein n=1 Tax=Thermoleophilum album TaxID=29539 RepID=UPI00237CACFA|nr:hypothetical protein [Thermoleophilum album]WDT94151.1 hypothetical protein JDY09_02540 [Thermoleophilum album]
MPEAPDTVASPAAPEHGKLATAGERGAIGPPLALDLAATLVLFAGFAALLVPLAIAVVEPRPIEGLPGFSQRQYAETATYVLLVGCGLPLAVAFGPRWVLFLARKSRSSAWLEIAAWATLLAVPVVVFRALATRSAGAEPGLLAAGIGAWWLAFAVRLVLLGRRSSAALAPALSPPAPSRRRLVAVGLVLPCFVYPLLFARSGAVRPLPIALVAFTAAAWLFAGRVRRATRRIAKERWHLFGERALARRALDVAVVAVLAAFAVNMVVFEPGALDRPLDRRIYDWVVAFHANFLLGPANQLAHGGTMLVDTVSQYGVGSIVALSRVVDLVSSGYGAVGLFDGLLTSLAVAAAWLILRTARVRLSICILALAFVVVVLLWGRTFPVGTIVQDGAFRTGITPWVIVGWLVSRRAPAAGNALVAVTVGVSAIWSFEVFALTSVTWLALVAAETWAAPARARRRVVRHGVLLYVAPALVAHALFALWTVVRSGQLPDWRLYGDFLRAFFLGQLREVTYDFTRWSPGIGLGGAYLAQAAVLGVLVTRRPTLARDLGERLPVLCALAVFGLACFFYLVDRSLDHVVIYVAQPLVLSSALWLDELVRRSLFQARSLLAVAIGAWGAVVVALALSAVWPKVKPAARDTLAWQAVHGTQRIVDRWRRLGDFPPVDPQAENGAVLLRTHVPGSSVLVLMPADLAVETLARAEKRNRLPLSFSLSDSFIAQEQGTRMQRLVERELRRVRDGDVALVDYGTLVFMRSVSEGRKLQLPRSVSVDTLRVRAFRYVARKFHLEPLRTRGQVLLVRLRRSRSVR